MKLWHGYGSYATEADANKALAAFQRRAGYKPYANWQYRLTPPS